MSDDDYQATEAMKGPAPPDPKFMGAAEMAAPSKKVTLTLTYIALGNKYRIRTLTNTTYYKPDQWLTEQYVTDIGKLPNWEYFVDSPDWLGMLLGIARRGASLL